MPDTPIFLDTTIQIGRQIHRPEIQASIEKRVAQHSQVISSLVVRQEFKRRLLKDATYLLKQFEHRKSYQNVMRHIADSLPPAQRRKMKICLDLLLTIDERDTDDDRTDRARLILRDLIKNGVATSEAQLTSIRMDSGCACALQPTIEKRPFKQYEFGHDRCSKMMGRCQVRAFLERNRPSLVKLHAHLVGLPDDELSDELIAIRGFMEKFFANPNDIEREDPCLHVGDLLIALESAGCPNFYTMNLRESRNLAPILGQKIFYRPPNSDQPEQEFPSPVRDA